jgi:hypothetical protein
MPVRTTIVASLSDFVFVGCLLFAGAAVAADGPCGLEAGIWASPADACRFSGSPDEAAKRFGQTALLELNRGFYRLEGATCGIMSATLAGRTCTLQIECTFERTRSLGQLDIAVSSARQLKFGTGADSPIYQYCAGEAPPRQ